MDLNKPFESRRSDVNRINTHGVKLHQYMVETLITGTGEAVVEIPFPVYFVDRPAFYTGLVLDDNITVVAQSFPTYSATVVRWNRITKQGENVGYFYKGATVAVRITGSDTQRAFLQTHFHGKAMRNPTTGLGIDGGI